MYLELITGSLEHRNQNNEIVHSADVQYERCDVERYVSLFQYDESIKRHFETIGSVAGYKGNLYMERLWIDVDDEKNPENAKVQAERMVKTLISNYGVDPTAISICFSGMKGYHIGLHENLFGGFEPSPDLPKKIKLLATRLIEGVDKIDLGIYNVNRAFRALNSSHPKTGLYKIGVSYEDFLLLSHEAIMFVAADVNEAYIFTTEMNPKKAVPKLKELWDFISNVASEDFTVEGGANDSSGGDFFDSATEGERNNSLFKQACMMFDKSDFPFPVVKKLLQHINNNSGNPIVEQELYQIARSAENRIRKAAVQDVSVRTWHTLAEQAGEIVDALEQKNGNYSLLFDRFDDIVQGDLAGKLIVIVGQGGTKKSIFAQQFLVDNCKRKTMRGVYNNQEMSKSQFLKRTMNMFTDEKHNEQYWQLLKNDYAKDRSEATKGLNAILRTDLAKRVIVDYKTAADSKHYRAMLEQVTKKEGRVDMLIVDGLSMMESRGDEKHNAEAHTKELKYLANEFNIPVLALVHVTKDVPKHTRDLTPFMRGSGKIFDNGDVFISCSLCVDETASNDDDITYRTDIGYLRMFDKRESGLTVNVVYEFDENTLNMSQHRMLSASDVEVKVRRKHD